MLRIIKTTDRRLEGITFPFNIDTLPVEVVVGDLKFENFKIITLGNNKYKIWNYNYVVEVIEVL